MSSIILFESKNVRRVWNDDEQKWYFSVQDVVEILTDSADIKQYVKRLRSRNPELGSNWGTICTLVEMTAADGKKWFNKLPLASASGFIENQKEALAELRKINLIPCSFS